MASSKRKRPSKFVGITGSKNQSKRGCKPTPSAVSRAVVENLIAAAFDASEGTDDSPVGSTTGLSLGRPRTGRTVKIVESTDSVSQSAVTRTSVPADLSLGDVCERLGLDYSQARSAIARGILPTGVDPKPGSGFHRRFTYAQAYHLAVALKINDAGVYLPLAGQIAAAAKFVLEDALQAGCGQDSAPGAGKRKTPKQWWLEVGNGRLIRFKTNAHPKYPGQTYSPPWTVMEIGQPGPKSDADITVIIQVNLVKIARQLCGRKRLPSSKDKVDLNMPDIRDTESTPRAGPSQN